MSEMDWKWFYLCMAELALFVAAGFAALHYRGKWLNSKAAPTPEKPQQESEEI